MSLNPALERYRKRAQLGRIPSSKPSLVDTETTEQRIFGWLPDVIKQGYNESITGLSRELATGKKPFEIDDFDRGVLSDVGAGLVSFFMPADLALTIGTGGVGSLAAKTAIKRAGSMATKQLARTGMQKKTRDFVVNQGLQRVTSGASGFGSYSGISNALRQKIETSEIDFGEVLTETGKGALLGAATAGVGARAVLKETPEAMRILQEGTILGGLTPALEGQAPTPQDFVNSIGSVMGIRGATASVSFAAKKAKGQLAESARAELEPLVKRMAKDQVNLERDITRRTDNFVSRTNSKDQLSIKSVTVKNNQKIFNLQSLDGKKSKGSLTEKQFRAKYKSSADSQTIIEKYKLFENEKGYSSDQIQQKRRLSLKLSGKKVPRNKKIKLEDFDSGELLSYSRDIQADYRLSQLKNRFKDLSDLPARTLLEHALPFSIAKFALPGQRRAKSLSSQIAFDLIDEADIATKRTFDRYQKRIDGVLKEIKAKDLPLIADILEDKVKGGAVVRGQAKELRVIFDEMYKYAESKGIKVADYRKDYFPQIIKKEIANIIGDDMLSMVKKRSELLEYGLSEGTVKDLNVFIQASLNRELRRETSDALRRMVADNKGTSYYDAFKKLQNEVIAQQLSPFGNLEKPRRIKLPENILDRNAYEVMTSYNMKLARRVELASRFGLKGERMYGKDNKGGLLREIAEKSYDEQKTVRHVFESFTGFIESDPFKNYSPQGKRLAEKVMAFEMSTKIALGTATIPNITQFMISTAMEAGYYRYFKSVAKVVTDKNYRDQLKASGVTYHNAMDVVLGTDLSVRNPGGFVKAIKNVVKEPNDRMLKIANILATVSGFKGINYANNLLAAATADGYIRDLHRIANTSNVQARKSWAISNLKKFKINYKKKLSEDELTSGMLTFARDTQLQKNVLKDPLAFNNPKMRPFFIFKRFGYRQAAYLGGVMRREVLENKNIVPLIRLGIGGFFGASFINKAREIYIKMLTGDETFKEDKDGLEDLFDRAQTIGALGFFGDVLEAESKIGAVSFMLNPVILSDIGKFTKSLSSLEKNIETFGVGEEAIRRSLRDSTPIFGTVLGKKIARGVETPSQRIDLLKSRKSKIKSKILDLMIEGKSELANKNVEQWNKKYPEFAFKPKDINFDTLYQRVLNKRKKIQTSQFLLEESK